MRDQPGGRRVERAQVGVGRGDDRGEARGELLAQFDAPLVEGIDVPDRRFDEDLVLVEGDEPPSVRGVSCA